MPNFPSSASYTCRRRNVAAVIRLITLSRGRSTRAGSRTHPPRALCVLAEGTRRQVGINAGLQYPRCRNVVWSTFADHTGTYQTLVTIQLSVVHNYCRNASATN